MGYFPQRSVCSLYYCTGVVSFIFWRMRSENIISVRLEPPFRGTRMPVLTHAMGPVLADSQYISKKKVPAAQTGAGAYLWLTVSCVLTCCLLTKRNIHFFDV